MHGHSQIPHALFNKQLRNSGAGTAVDGGASPLRSARRSRDAAQRFRHEPS